MMPQVSVLMPVHNGARWLAEAVTSLQTQTLKAFELLVIDDGSEDETPRLLDGFARADERVQIIRQPHLGLVAALNRGIAEAHAPLIARLDADDRALPERLARQAAFLGANPEIGLVGSWADIIDDTGVVRGRLTPATQRDELAQQLLRGNPFVHSSIMARTDLLRRLGGFRAAFEAAEDYDLWLRVAEVAGLANIPETLIQYRRHAGNVTHRKAMRQSFSVRLALRSAEARRSGHADPASALAEPPDWHAREASSSFYAEDAALYCLLDLADLQPPGERVPAGLDLSPLVARLAELTHAERRLAAAAILVHLRYAERADAVRTRQALWRMMRHDPGILVRAAWTLRS